MTTHHDIIALILSESGDRGFERDDVLEALCKAFCAAYDNENEDERPIDCEVLPDETAHRYYLDCYYKAGPELRTDKDTYLGSNPREVSVPEWAPNHRKLLRTLAQAERKSDERMLRYCRREMGADRADVV